MTTNINTPKETSYEQFKKPKLILTKSRVNKENVEKSLKYHNKFENKTFYEEGITKRKLDFKVIDIGKSQNDLSNFSSLIKDLQNVLKTNYK